MIGNIRNFILASILALLPGVASAQSEVVLQILNPENPAGQINLTIGDSVEVSYTVTELGSDPLSKNDNIQLVFSSDGSVVSSKNRGKNLMGSVSLQVPNSATSGQYVVQYTRDTPNPPFPNVVAEAPAAGVVLSIGAAQNGPQDGINCWDLNGNRINDPTEDTNQDGFFDALDCQGAPGADGIDGAPGPQGPAGTDGMDGADGAVGPQGPTGADGLDGISCWDLDADRVNDPEEDINGDTLFNGADCTGPEGPQGPSGTGGGGSFSAGVIFDVSPSGVVTIRKSKNISGVTRTGVGSFTISFTSGTFSDADYMIQLESRCSPLNVCEGILDQDNPIKTVDEVTVYSIRFDGAAWDPVTYYASFSSF